MRIPTSLLAAGVLVLASGDAWAVKLGIAAYQLSTETQTRAAHAAKAAAEDKGWLVTLVDAKGSAAAHAAQVEGLLQGGVDGLVLVMSRPKELEAPLKSARTRKVPVISVMSGAGPWTLFDVTVNEYAVGAQIGLYLLGVMGYEGNLVMQRYPASDGPRIRGKVMDVILSENPTVRLLDSASVTHPQAWQDETRQAMTTLVQKHAGKLQAVWTALDGQAFVVDDLLQAKGYKKGQVLVTSVEGGQEAFRRIRDPNSLLAATVAIPFELMGEAAVDALDDLLAGVPKEQITTGPYLFMDAVLVDANNVPAEGEWPW